MSTYKLIGQRILRKYTAARTSPVYAASTDAQLVVSSLCDVPWKKVSAKDATMTYHTEENVGSEESPIKGLDKNVLIRDEFDAALFCAEHTGGQHRCYANAAVYRYELPNAAVGVSLTSLKLSVTSDPYNSNGARIHLMTNSTGVVPTNCHTCRGENSSGTVVEDGTTASRVAVRTSQTVAGKEYWYPTSAACTITPTGGLTLQKYLFVFVLMESYSTVRGNWIEGCSFIENKVEMTTATGISGWTDGETIDLASAPDNSFAVLKDGILPMIPSGCPDGSRTVIVRADAERLANDDGTQNGPVSSASGNSAASALGRLFHEFFSGKGDAPSHDVPTRSAGAFFRVTRATEVHVLPEETRPVPADVLKIESQAVSVPFVLPDGFSAGHVRLSFQSLSMTPGARFNVFYANDYLTSVDLEKLKSPGLYDLKDAPLTLLGTIDGGTSATFALPPSSSRAGSVVISGWMPPDAFSLTTGGTQGTGDDPFLPDVTVTD